jgi:hypothetical protein
MECLSQPWQRSLPVLRQVGDMRGFPAIIGDTVGLSCPAAKVVGLESLEQLMRIINSGLESQVTPRQ